MGDVERDAFLTSERTCRVGGVGGVGGDGAPHVTLLWFVWDGTPAKVVSWDFRKMGPAR